MAKTVETTEARGNLADLAGRVATRGKRIVVQRRGQPLAVLIGMDEYDRLRAAGRRPRKDAISPDLLQRQRTLVSRARQLRARHGDPVDGLAELLKSLPPANDSFWVELSDAPF